MVNWDDRVEEHTLTDVGMKRSHNQDAFAVAKAANRAAWDVRGHLFVVADGMGAHAVGEMASKMAVENIQMSYSKSSAQCRKESLRQAIVDANKTIHQRGQQNREFEGMGTTATALVLCEQGAIVGHVGDSRCYRIRGPNIDQISFDHSLQWELARRQKVRPEQLKSVPSNIIVRSLGPSRDVKIDLNGPYAVEDGDCFVLCSDGLSGPLSDKEIWAIVSHLPGDEACQFLVDLANIRGGLDNITVVVVRVGKHVVSDSELPPIPWYAPHVDRVLQQWRKIPLPWRFYIIGCFFAGVGYALKAAKISPAIFGLLGFLGIALWCGAWFTNSYLRRKAEEKGKEPPPQPPPIFRTRGCAVDPHLLDTMVRHEKDLREVASEDSWKVGWKKFDELKTTAQKDLEENRLVDAFRGYCRLLSMLCAGMRERKDRHEVFRPHWDRNQKS